MSTSKSLQSAYIELSNASGIKVGDTVKVLRTAKSHEMGWGNSWVSKMDNAVGKSFTVLRIGSFDNNPVDGFELNVDGYTLFFPFFVLEKVIPPVPMEKIVHVSGATICLHYIAETGKVISTVIDAGRTFYIDDLRTIIKEVGKFRKEHRDAEKAS